MDRIDEVARRFQSLLGPVTERMMRESGVIQRAGKLGGPELVQTLTLAWLTNPNASLSQLTQMAAARKVDVSPQALDQRFTPALVGCLERLLGVIVAALSETAASDPVTIPLLQRFSGVWIIDSTTCPLPDSAAARWPGCGGHPGDGQAALKVQTRLDLLRGRLDRVDLTAGRAQDRAAAVQHAPLPPGSLRLSDQGYFSLAVFRAIAEADSFWLSRLPSNIAILTADGERVPPDSVPTWLRRQATANGTVEVPVRLGLRDRVPARLLAMRVPKVIVRKRRRRLRQDAKKKGQPVSQRSLDRAGWTILVTNVPTAQLSLTEARSLYRARWQIECLFKRWKHDGQLTTSRSQKPIRRQVELLAKLIGQVLLHWLSLLSDWTIANKSLANIEQVVRDHIRLLAVNLDRRRDLCRALEHMQRCLRAATRLQHRTKHPATVQYLLNSDLEP